MNIKVWTVTNEYCELIVNGDLIKTTYTLNGNGRKIVTIASGSYFLDTLN
jgi:hypothetical protein